MPPTSSTNSTCACQVGHVVEAGTGSGALTLALAWAVAPEGMVYTYEVRAENFNTAAENLRRANLHPFVKQFQESISDGIHQRGVDAVFLDVRRPWHYLAQVRAALRPGGFFTSLMPTTNQVTELARFAGSQWLRRYRSGGTAGAALQACPRSATPRRRDGGPHRLSASARPIVDPEDPKRWLSQERKRYEARKEVEAIIAEEEERRAARTRGLLARSIRYAVARINKTGGSSRRFSDWRLFRRFEWACLPRDCLSIAQTVTHDAQRAGTRFAAFGDNERAAVQLTGDFSGSGVVEDLLGDFGGADGDAQHSALDDGGAAVGFDLVEKARYVLGQGTLGCAAPGTPVRQRQVCWIRGRRAVSAAKGRVLAPWRRRSVPTGREGFAGASHRAARR
ncbi:MAG: hypothetical protein R2873_35955 [Caldilineaceae bacterium]